MPPKDPERRRAIHREWMARNLKQGYGKWLYRKRQLVREDMERFRATLEKILSDDIETLEAARIAASGALHESRKEWKELGTWRETRIQQEIESLEGKSQ